MQKKLGRGEFILSCEKTAMLQPEKQKQKFMQGIRIIPVLVILLFLGASTLFAGIIPNENFYSKEISQAYTSIKPLARPSFADSLNSFLLPPAQKPRLLPKRISFMEKYLWGENGLTRKMGIVPALSPNERIHELHIRRAMLTAHQIGGFTTLALMLSACYFGQQVIDGHRHMGDIHQTLVSATMISYSITGLLAILSPPPLIRRNEAGTVVIHKTLAWIHLAGMIITPILGSLIGGRRHFNINKAHFHQVAGYITTAVFTASMLVITF